MRHDRKRTPRTPLDEEGLERLGLAYVGRYSTTCRRLGAYLSRKVKERGWSGASPPPIEQLVDRFAALGYVDDRAFASARASSLLRRGYGARRIDQAFRAAGINAVDAAEVREQVEEGAYAAAQRFAERKRLGPFSSVEPDGRAKGKAIAAMLRAGHSMDMIRRILGQDRSEELDSF